MSSRDDLSLIREVLGWTPEYGDDEATQDEARAALDRIETLLARLETAYSFIGNINAHADESLLRLRIERAQNVMREGES